VISSYSRKSPKLPVARSLSDHQVRLLRLRAQQPDSRRSHSGTGIRQVVKRLCGVQAHDASAAGEAGAAGRLNIGSSRCEGTEFSPAKWLRGER